MFGQLVSGVAASVFLLCSWSAPDQARVPGPFSVAELRDDRGESPSRQLKIPRPYMESNGGAPVRGGLVILRARYPSMEPEPLAAQSGTPRRDSVRIILELTTDVPAQQDIGQFVLNAHLSGAHRLVELDSRSAGQEVRLYRSADSRNDAMSFIDASGKTVFVLCTLSTCRAQRSWGSSRMVSYQFDRRWQSQAVAVDAGTMRLLGSFP
jgi:hypothetical protein